MRIYAITEEQKAVLNQFTCERLRDDPDNQSAIRLFHSQRGPGVVAHLHYNGWKEDKMGSNAYYVVKAPTGEIVMFFSLKCGTLFDPGYYQIAKALQQGKESNVSKISSKKRKIGRFIRYTDEEFYDAQDDYYDLPSEQRDTIDAFRGMLADEEEEPNRKTTRVKVAHAAIELLEFCLNDGTRHLWKQYDMGRKQMGETLFWWFIVPKMLQIGSLAGCEYVYTYVPDASPDGTLMNYYENGLHFMNFERLGTFKAIYDVHCHFMCRRLRTLKVHMIEDDDLVEEMEELLGLDYYRERFFNTFNEEWEEEDLV